MSEHEFEGPDGRRWIARERPVARRDDGDMQLTVDLETIGERRVVTCLRGEWEVATPDFHELLARSVPGGASRALGGLDEPPPDPRDEPEPGSSAW